MSHLDSCKTAALLVMVCLLAGLTGCGRDGKSAGDAGAPSSGSTSAAPSAAASETTKPGYISGRITRQDGSPVAITGTTYSILILGVSGQGENVEFHPTVDTDGNFSLKVPSGIYHRVQASMKVPFDGSFYTYVPDSTTMLNDAQSDAGIIANFAWKISGPTPANRDQPSKESPNDWFGAVCSLQWQGDYLDAQGHSQPLTVPNGSSFVLTASPNGKLIDGSDAKPLTFNLSWDPIFGIKPSAINDLPPAVNGWHIAGKLNHPDGSSVALLFKANFANPYAPGVDVKMLAPPAGSMAGGLPAMGVPLFMTESH